MKHLGLFAGIGGFELAARWAGWETIAWCEWDKFCQHVLKYHFPDADQHSDIRKTDFTRYAGRVDILTGGFPCQPYSTAGKRLGKEDERHLWPEMLRAIREVSPRWVVGENVRGLVNWSGGMVFDEVQSDLEAKGYEVIPFLLPAAGVDAPHIRDRIWFIAHRADARSEGLRKSKECTNKSFNASNADRNGYKLRGLGKDQPAQDSGETIKRERQRVWGNTGGTGESSDAANSDSSRRRQLNLSAFAGGKGYGSRVCDAVGIPDWRRFPTQSPVCGRNDGISGGLARITVSNHRRNSIKALGNAIVPQVALKIFNSINQYENEI